MKKVMCIDYDLCVGCGICQMECSLTHEGECSPKRSRIQIVRNEEKAIFMPVLCRQCKRPMCVASCPKNALHQDPITRVISVDEELCNGCGICLSCCPYGAISLHPDKEIAFICDLCGGKPKCVEFCPTGVLRFLNTYQMGEVRRGNVMENVMSTVIENRNLPKEA